MRICLIIVITVAIFAFFGLSQCLAGQCNVAVTNLGFGNYDILSPSPLDSTASINVTCKIPPQNPKAPIAVTVTLSSGSSGNFAQRQMLSAGPDRLNYNLYTNASFSTIWGDGGGSSSTQTRFISRATPWNGTIFGRIPARQNVRGGVYSDSITATIFY